MREHFLNFIWHHRLYDQQDLRTTENQKLVVLHPGQPNPNAGPDFFFARLRIDDVLWIGHVEIHTSSSHWSNHGHSQDPAYESVILHVVFRDDQPVHYQNQKLIPTLCLHSRIKSTYLEKNTFFSLSHESIPCAGVLHSVRPILISQTMQSRAWERIERKSLKIAARLEELKGHLQQSLFELVFRTWGFGLNHLLFEDLARTLPVEVVLKNSHDVFRIESLLLGHAGLIKPVDEYGKRMQKEYTFLTTKYDLPKSRLVPASFLRTRPYNFPTIRLAQLAAIFSHEPTILLSLENFTSLSQWKAQCAITSNYWTTHYDFGKKTNRNYFTPGVNTVLSSYLDFVVPACLMLARKKDDMAHISLIREELERLPVQENHIIRQWRAVGVKPKNGLESQGLLHLFREYCSPKKCLHCPIGSDIMLSDTALREPSCDGVHGQL